MKVNYDLPKFDFCRRGHAMVGDNVLTTIRQRQCKICLRLGRPKREKSPFLSEPVVRRIVAAINEGGTRTTMTGSHKERSRGPRLVKRRRLNAFIAANPKLGEWMKKKMAENAKRHFYEAMSKRRIHIAAPALIRNMDVLDDINAALTMWLDPVTERPDVLSAMWTAVAEGRLSREDIKSRAKEFVAAHRRQYTNIGRYGNGSLDAPAYREGPLPLIETITTGLWQ